MSSEEQAEAYFEEARLTFQSARAIHDAAVEREDMWAQVVKNAYDAMEQAISAAIAEKGQRIPRNHPGKVNTFLELTDPGEPVEEALLYWLRRRSDSQYVDIRGDEINIPHELFGRADAERIMDDAGFLIEFVGELLDLDQ